jgi:hypothetical protein
MAVEMVLYKTLYGTNDVYVFGGVQPDLAADMVNDAIKAMADACEALEAGVTGPQGSILFSGTAVTGTGTGISATVSGSRAGDYYLNTSTGNYYTASAENVWDYLFCAKGADGTNGTNGVSPTVTPARSGSVTTLTIVDANGTHTAEIYDGVTGWTEGTLVDGSNTLTDAASLYSATGMAGASIVAGSGWTTGHTARVGITFAASSTFSYPSTWVCVGDDCSGGDFTFSQGSSYWLTIECRPDATWMFVMKVPA